MLKTDQVHSFYLKQNHLSQRTQNITAIIINLKHHDTGIMTSHNGCQKRQGIKQMIYG